MWPHYVCFVFLKAYEFYYDCVNNSFIKHYPHIAIYLYMYLAYLSVQRVFLWCALDRHIVGLNRRRYSWWVAIMVGGARLLSVFLFPSSFYTLSPPLWG